MLFHYYQFGFSPHSANSAPFSSRSQSSDISVVAIHNSGRYGLSLIFENIIPDSAYYPEKDAVIPLCIIDSGIARSHPDLSNVDVIAADPSQNNMIEDECSHGTVSIHFHHAIILLSFVVFFTFVSVTTFFTLFNATM